jgi:hypothetical protein
MNVMTPLDAILDLHGDQQADGNREEMEEEFPEPVD